MFLIVLVVYYLSHVLVVPAGWWVGRSEKGFRGGEGGREGGREGESREGGWEGGRDRGREEGCEGELGRVGGKGEGGRVIGSSR